MQARQQVFVIDDDLAARHSVVALLEANKWVVRDFGSAEDFLAADFMAALPLDGPACILSDVRLPGISGLDLLIQLGDKGVGIPVILISGYAAPELAARAMSNGAHSVVEKPVDPYELIDQIRKAIESCC